MASLGTNIFDSSLDQLPHSLNLTSRQARSMGWTHYVVNGATNQQGTGADVSDFYVSGASTTAGGSTKNSFAGALNHNMSNGVAIDGGSLAIVGNDAVMYGGTALSNSSIEAVGSGIISGGVVGYSGAIFAGAVTSGPNADRAQGPGTALDPHVGSGGYALVGGGGSSFVIKGYLANGAGGLMSGGTFNPGSYTAVGLGGTALGGTFGGTELVGSGGTSLNQLFVGSGASQITNAGIVSQSTAISGGVVFASGGTLNNPVASQGGTIRVAGGTYVTFLNAGFQISYGTYQPGTSFNNVTSSGGTELVEGDGTAFYSTILSGAQGTVLAGGTTIYPKVNGGSEIISSAGSIISGSAYNGGQVSLLSSGRGSALSAYSGGTITNDGGSVQGLYINNGGSGAVYDGGLVQNFYVNSGGSGAVYSGGSAQGLYINNGGSAAVYSGGSAQGVSVNDGGSGTVYAGGQVQDFYVNNGGSAILSNGTATHFVINSGGQATITSGAVISSGATVNAGGSTLVLPSGATADYLVASNGTVTDLPGGPYPFALYAAGSGGTGLLTQSGLSAGIASAGYDPNNSAASGGTVIVSNGGIASRGGAQSGGTFILASGGTATTVGAGAGGTSVVGSGGTASGFTPISGGTATVLAGANIGSGGSVQVSGASGQNGLLSIDSGNQLAEVDVGSGGTARLNSGGSIGYLSAGTGGSIALSSGVSVPTVMLNGATATISAVGTGVQTLSAVNGASGIINSGASINSVFLSSGNATLSSGAFVSQLTIMSGASGILMSGASVHQVSVNSGGWVSGANISNNNELAVASDGTALDTVITYDSGTGSHVSNPYTMVSSGGYVSGATIVGADGSTDPQDLGGLLTIDSGATLINTSMGYNARIRVNGLKYATNWTTSVSDGVLYVTEGTASGGTTWKMALNGNYDSGGFIVNDDGQGNSIIIYEKCFLPGSMIRTPRGDKAVERLRKGELVCTYQDGREEIREITAVIQRRARVDVSRPEDMAGWSVLISKDAFGPGLPDRDLSVTPEHCFLFEGRFVPVRMLINGLSIRYDHSQVEYDYYHVKTESHSVIRANGVLTESWLDTDEQARCEEDGTGALRLAELEQLDWNRHAAAPLEVGQPFVKPLHDRFAARAAELGLAAPDAPTQSLADNMTMDPALHVRLENGDSLQPQRQEAGRHFFSLPAYARQVTLCSRTFRPSESVGPHLDDRRRLGVLVGQVSVWTGGRETILTRHLTDRDLKGWDVIEAGPHRWTNGEAVLPLRDGPTTGTAHQLLIIEVEAGGPYLPARTGADNDRPA